jgi:hypothetical protein
MKQWIAISIVAAFASGAAAQTGDPKAPNKDKQKEVQAVTQREAPSSVNTQKTAAEQAANVKASKATTKMTTAEKNKAIKDVNKQMVNPENPSGSVAGTAAQQKANVEVSKGEPRQSVNVNTLGSQKAMEKAATK